MFSNRLAFAALAATCIAAAGTGGYFALRQNGAGAAIAPPSANTATTPATAEDRPVQETEAVVGDSHPAIAPNPSPAKAAPAGVKRTEPVGRTAAAAPASSGAAKSAKASTSRGTTPPLDHTWPSSAGAPSVQPSGQPSPIDSAAPSTRADDRGVQLDAPAVHELPQKTYEELVVSADSVIGLQNETTVTSERARVEDRVEARVTRDVRVGDRIAIPAGARALGLVTQVDRGGKFKERARLGIRFQTIVLADGTRLPISTNTIYRDGQAPGNESAAKIGGGAVGGAIIGAIIGGAKGAAIGGMTGAGAGGAVVAAGDRNPATLRAGESVTVHLMSPVTVTSERDAR